MRRGFIAVSFVPLTTSVRAQWLMHPTQGIPRTAEGRPDLTGPVPRTADGKPDLTGLWNAPVQIGQPSADSSYMSAWAKDVAERRELGKVYSPKWSQKHRGHHQGRRRR
jgi:hypothetical protein